METLKNFWSFLIGIGWSPLPFVTALAIVVLCRKFFESDVLSVDTTEKKRKHDIIKVFIILGAFVGSFSVQIGLSEPKDPFDVLTCIAYPALDMAIVYVAYSFFQALDNAINFKELIVKIIKKKAGVE